MTVPSSVAIIGAPLDLGQGRRGVDMGPSAIRYAGLEEALATLDRPVTDTGNVVTPEPEAIDMGHPSARFLPAILEACAKVSGAVERAVLGGAFPLVLGGDHSIAFGTLSGLARAAGQSGGAIWLDAHGDLNTPSTSPSGNVHGMPLAAVLGLGGNAFTHPALTVPSVDPRRLSVVGVRSLDDGERALIRAHGIRVYTMSEIDRIGIERVILEALDRAAGPGFVHVSLDLDVLDPGIAPGVGTPVPGGLTYREAHLACELAAESGLLGSFELVEVNPILDRANRTAHMAVELVASALGRKIL